MKQISIFLLLFAIIFTGSCNSEKTYKYVELVKEENNSGMTETKEKNQKDIIAESDSSAYLEAYRTFCTSVKSYKDKLDFMGRANSVPLKFRLLDEKGTDIAGSVNFDNKQAKEREIEYSIFSKEFSIKEYMENGGIDNRAKIEELNQYIASSKKDEFDPDQVIWHRPKSASKYADEVYCYFSSAKGAPGALRFRIQFSGDELIFFGKVQFSIDGNAYEYIPSGTRTDIRSDGKIREWFDEPLRETGKELINALANAQSAKIKFIGKQRSVIRTISTEQAGDIKRVVELYRLMGGEF
jgi:hypothetical protein